MLYFKIQHINEMVKICARNQVPFCIGPKLMCKCFENKQS